jgi:hypothetical protein
MTTKPTNERDEAIKTIKANLERRTGRKWSVRGGTGTAWGWITISAPPARKDDFGRMSEDDQRTLATALGFPDRLERQGFDVAASSDYRAEYIARSAGETPAKIAQPYWD